MKKLALTIAIALGITFTGFAQERGLFDKGPEAGFETNDYYYNRDGQSLINLPGSHGSSDDAGAPLGTGALLLIGFGAAYALKKRNK